MQTSSICILPYKSLKVRVASDCDVNMLFSELRTLCARIWVSRSNSGCFLVTHSCFFMERSTFHSARIVRPRHGHGAGFADSGLGSLMYHPMVLHFLHEKAHTEAAHLPSEFPKTLRCTRVTVRVAVDWSFLGISSLSSGGQRKSVKGHEKTSYPTKYFNIF